MKIREIIYGWIAETPGSRSEFGNRARSFFFFYIYKYTTPLHTDSSGRDVILCQPPLITCMPKNPMQIEPVPNRGQ